MYDNTPLERWEVANKILSCPFESWFAFILMIWIFFFFLSSVLVTHTDAVKISDFGTSKELSDKSTKMSFAGTVAWMAPEVIRNEPVSEKVDIWWVLPTEKSFQLSLYGHFPLEHFWLPKIVINIISFLFFFNVVSDPL